MPTYTPAEERVLARNRKSPGSRPRIFSLTSSSDVEISEDFEAFLILSSVNARAALASWINLQIASIGSNVTRDFIFTTEVLPDETFDITARIAFSKQLTGPFELMKTALNVGKFGTVPEVAQMLNDLTLTTKGMTHFSEFAYHQFAILTKLINTVSKAGEAEIRAMLRSYVTAIVAYNDTRAS